MNRALWFLLGLCLIASSALAQPKPELYNQRRQQSGIVMVPKGSAAKPTVAFETASSGEDDGLFFDFDLNRLCAAINGVQVACFDASGLVLSGFTPGSVIFVDSAGGLDEDNANLFWNDTLNRLGIGTTTPGFDLHIVKDSALAAILVDHSGTLFSSLTLDTYNNTVAAFASTLLWERARGTRASPAVVQSGDAVGSFAFQLYDGSAFGKGADFLVEVDGAVGVGDRPARFVFRTAKDGTGSVVERIRIPNDGGLRWNGIATASLPAVSAADTGQIYYDSTLDKWQCSASGGAYADCTQGFGSALAIGGSDSHIQYNNGGVLGGSANWTFDDTNFRVLLQNATTAGDGSTNMLRTSGTLPSVPTAGVTGVVFNVTGAGSASFEQFAVQMNLLAGYSGNQRNAALLNSNQSLGIGNDFKFGSSVPILGNVGNYSGATGTGTGLNVGAHGVGANSTGNNAGVYGTSVSVVGGSNFGVVGHAFGSTEGADFKNVASYFTLGSLITGSNVSAALVLDNGSGADSIARFYDNGVLVAELTDGGSLAFGTDPADAGTIRLANGNSIQFEASPTGTDVVGLTLDTQENIEIGSGGNALEVMMNRVAIGTNPASTGTISFPNFGTLIWRNAANTNNVTALTVNASNVIAIGSTDGQSAGIEIGNSSNRDAINTIQYQTASLDFGATGANVCEVVTFSMTGAADGDVCMVGAPNAATSTNTNYTCFVSAADTISVKRCNVATSAASDPAAATFEVSLIQN